MMNSPFRAQNIGVIIISTYLTCLVNIMNKQGQHVGGTKHALHMLNNVTRTQTKPDSDPLYRVRMSWSYYRASAVYSP